MSPITARSRHAETPRTHVHSHRTDVVKAGNYYAGATQPRAHSLRSRDPAGQKPLGACYVLWNNPPTGFSWGYNGSGPAQLALAILTDYFGAKPGGKALAEALYEPFKFTVIAVLPDRWEMNFEEVGIALCRTLTEEPDRLTVSFAVLRALFLMISLGAKREMSP